MIHVPRVPSQRRQFALQFHALVRLDLNKLHREIPYSSVLVRWSSKTASGEHKPNWRNHLCHQSSDLNLNLSGDHGDKVTLPTMAGGGYLYVENLLLYSRPFAINSPRPRNRCHLTLFGEVVSPNEGKSMYSRFHRRSFWGSDSKRSNDVVRRPLIPSGPGSGNMTAYTLIKCWNIVGISDIWVLVCFYPFPVFVLFCLSSGHKQLALRQNARLTNTADDPFFQ